MTLRVRRELPPGTGQDETPGWADQRAVLLSQAGRPRHCPPPREPVALHQELAAALPGRYNPYFARSLINSGVSMSALGRVRTPRPHGTAPARHRRRTPPLLLSGTRPWVDAARRPHKRQAAPDPAFCRRSSRRR